MIQTRTISNFTEIYSDQNGGGKSEIYITESYPTMFPTFTVRRFLAAGQTPADFREVTAAERAKLEAAAEAWTRPPQFFIDLWNTACGVWGRYNEETGYFELNGLTDISYEEAIQIYRTVDFDNSSIGKTEHYKSRTNIPPLHLDSFNRLCFGNSTFEIFNAGNSLAQGSSLAFYKCSRLREIINLNLQNVDTAKTDRFFCNLPELQYVEARWLNSNVIFEECPNLDLPRCWKYWERNQLGTDFTINVHPDVYAKLTGDSTNAAAAALTEEELAE